MSSITFTADPLRDHSQHAGTGRDLGDVREIFLRYHYFELPTTLTVGTTAFLEDTPTPMLDFTPELLYTVERLEKGLNAAISFTEHTDVIELLTEGETLNLGFRPDQRASCRIEEFTEEALRFSRLALSYTFEHHPSLRHNTYVQGIARQLQERELAGPHRSTSWSVGVRRICCTGGAGVMRTGGWSGLFDFRHEEAETTL
ncbi:hypothetical protein ACH4U5_01140 [Streptomyces sp. NPDC020858]|uniref:hypothetical protein n=1 Tax=Streptomyces sp. NPDC020858 TaxID=3365097 RepID=UPI0037BC2E0A